jgi:pimeloyl-ACP methyl ester carboxylesterase
MATFVLVHGSWHGGWCWRLVTPLLRAAGHDVYTPTLTGLGERAHLVNSGVTLETHIEDVVNLLFYEDLSDVALVGHSYAGVVVSGVAARVPERLACVLYLDAYLPPEGHSLFDVWSPEERETARAQIAAGPGLRQPASPAGMGIVDPDLAAWVAARLTPHPLRTYEQPIPAGTAASAGLPRAYIHCTAGPTTPRFAPFAQRARGEGWAVRELATGHDAMLIVPRELTALLCELQAILGTGGASESQVR